MLPAAVPSALAPGTPQDRPLLVATRVRARLLASRHRRPLTSLLFPPPDGSQRQSRRCHRPFRLVELDPRALPRDVCICVFFFRKGGRGEPETGKPSVEPKSTDRTLELQTPGWGVRGGAAAVFPASPSPLSLSLSLSLPPTTLAHTNKEMMIQEPLRPPSFFSSLGPHHRLTSRSAASPGGPSRTGPFPPSPAERPSPQQAGAPCSRPPAPPAALASPSRPR